MRTDCNGYGTQIFEDLSSQDLLRFILQLMPILGIYHRMKGHSEKSLKINVSPSGNTGKELNLAEP